MISVEQLTWGCVIPGGLKAGPRIQSHKTVIASEAKQSRAADAALDCFVGSASSQ
ncbi:hypothetical protein [Methylocystis sp. Sn-Cys]|uniref:hypothetical protein n=1 Tax=Methylocystis sp. Sn-Cys TaxID=1701263 RepID=UPI0019234535|nr:hypothetical protein [Methylocystis sp. Sn-Cys]MBL1257628.1 hypothetical protein [Methylocystis sp. Sn-Cys]